MPRSSRQQRKPPQRFQRDDSEIDTESEAESVSDYQATSNSEDERCDTPDSQRDAKCVVCSRNVLSSDKSLQCDTCSEWCHIKCGGVTKEHYRQMVQLDEGNIEISWECPPCHAKSHPEPDPEPPQQTVAKLPPRPRATPSEPVPRPSPVTPMTMPRPILPSNGVIRAVPQTNGGGGINNGMNFPDVRDSQNQNLAFYLTQEQANIVNNGRKVETNGMVVYKMHILLRFTKMSSDGIQDDDFPKNVVLKVNNKICPLPNPKPVPANRPNLEAKRPPKPLIITSLCKLTTKSCLNQLSVTWVPRKDDTPYTISIYLVEKLTPDDLLKKLKLRGQRDPQVTKNVISAKLEDKDDEISTSSVKVTMGCPLSMTRMTYPSRASTCDHLQCFDADMFIKMNEKKPKWVCPVCNKPAYFEHLFLDGFYIQLLLSEKFKALSTNEIILNNDASWEAVEETALGVSDSDDDEYAAPAPPVKKVTSSTTNTNGYTTIDDDDISVIPIAPMTDSDGAPLLSSTAIPTNVPTNNTLASNQIMSPATTTVTLTNTQQRDLEDDVLAPKRFAPELDYCDWNYSVKFFQFLRDAPPPRKEDTPPPSPAADSASISEISDSGTSTKTLDSFEYTKRGRGRGGRGATRGRGRGAKRSVSQDLEDDTEIPTKVIGAGTARGRGRARGRGGAKAAPKQKKIQTKRRRAETSEEESEASVASSEEEEEVVTKPPPRSGRSTRNTKRVNYAAIEESFEVIDSFV